MAEGQTFGFSIMTSLAFTVNLYVHTVQNHTFGNKAAQKWKILRFLFHHF